MDNSKEAGCTSAEMAESARTRASFSSLLNVHFITLPDSDFVKRIRDTEFCTAMESLANDQALPADLSVGASLMLKFMRDNADVADAELSDILGRDRTTLYRGLTPKESPAPPCEAVWSRTRPNVTELLQELVAIYRQSGMFLAEETGERLDYIGVEMDYMRQLAEREAEAWQTGEEETGGELFRQQSEFFTSHLGEWAPFFLEKALSMVKTDFYRGHLTMLRGFLAYEEELFGA